MANITACQLHVFYGQILMDLQMNKRRIYLDNCSFNRPYDDQGFLSIYLETQAKLSIQDLVNKNQLDLVWSFILDYENSFNPDESIEHEISLWRDKACSVVKKNSTIVNNAMTFIASGFGQKDSLHIAAAIDATADYFITVDKGILRKQQMISDLKIINPIDFIRIFEGD